MGSRQQDAGGHGGDVPLPAVEHRLGIKELPLSASDPDQRMLLHDMADKFNAVSDQLPLPDQIRLDPALSEILDDEVRHLARLLAFLAGESAFRHRAATRYPARPTATATATVRRTTLALASAAEPAGLALAALGAAVRHLGQLADLAHQAPGPARTRAIAIEQQRLVDRLGDSRIHLARAAKQLRTAADTRTPPAATVPSAAAAASPSRSR
ncbi:hypothetical protein ACFY1L_36130 [Streptomyces sp. NPDC001663]|uniref:hypothetical protein n=1 Tax=Streptomyces sp. NPDC001663 TaxID=3364597 RepID=UPI0036ACD4BE